MTVPSPADGSVHSKCSKCGAGIIPTAKFCSECGATQAKSAPASIKQFTGRNRRIKVVIYTLCSIVAVIVAVAMIVTYPNHASQPKAQQSPAVEQGDNDAADRLNPQLVGTPIDFDALYAKAHTGLAIGVRYHFSGGIDNEGDIVCGTALPCDTYLNTKPDFDDRGNYEALLKSGGMGMSCDEIVVSMGYDQQMHVHRTEGCTVTPNPYQ